MPRPPVTPTAGERWAHDQLRALREARFAPPAMARFLLAAQRRANATRAARPGLARQEARWVAAGTGAYLAIGRPKALRWWVGVALMLDWHLGMVETEDGEPRLLGPADALTLTRAWLVPIAAEDPRPATILAGAATDVLDGAAARATAPTRLGRDLEALVDACFAGATLWGLGRRDRLPRAVVRFESGRLALGTGLATAAWFGRDRPPEPAILRAGRRSTPIRTAAVLSAAAGHRRTGVVLLVAGGLLASADQVRLIARSGRS